MAEYLPEITNHSVSSVDAKEEVLNECESIWQKMEEVSYLSTEQVAGNPVSRFLKYDKLSTQVLVGTTLEDVNFIWKFQCQSKLKVQGGKTLPKSDNRLSLLTTRVKALQAEYNQWQKRTPEIISNNPDVLLALGKEELQKTKNELEMVLSIIKSKNEKLEEDLRREQQWHQEQEQVLNSLNRIEEGMKTQTEQLSIKRALQQLQNKKLKVKSYKEGLLNALGEFLGEHFPLPEKGGSTKKQKSFEKPAVELLTLYEILEILIQQLISTPHDPYVIINDSFWPPYIELLLRYGIALRHPEDPNRMRLEAFHT